MTTANDLIDRAYVLLGYKDPSDALSGQDAAYALDALNDLIDTWNTDRLFIVAVSNVSASIAGNPITIGASMTFNVTRPTEITSGFVRIDSVDYPVEWITQAEYDELPLKSTASTVAIYGYYDRGVPTGNIYLYPETTGTLHLQLPVQITEFADLTTDYDLAPGYRKAIAYSLAEELAPGLRALDPVIARTGARARTAIRRTNSSVPQLNLEVGQITGLNVGFYP